MSDFVEYCDCGSDSDLYLYADDTKLFKHIKIKWIWLTDSAGLDKIERIDACMASSIKYCKM